MFAGNVHRVLLAAAVVLNIMLTFWAIGQWGRGGAGMPAFASMLSCSVIAVLAACVVYFGRNLALMRHVGDSKQCSGEQTHP